MMLKTILKIFFKMISRAVLKIIKIKMRVTLIIRQLIIKKFHKIAVAAAVAAVVAVAVIEVLMLVAVVAAVK